jgi:hypothetical protein
MATNKYTDYLEIVHSMEDGRATNMHRTHRRLSSLLILALYIYARICALLLINNPIADVFTRPELIIELLMQNFAAECSCIAYI